MGGGRVVWVVAGVVGWWMEVGGGVGTAIDDAISRASASPRWARARPMVGGDGAARCSTVRLSSLPERRRYRLESPQAWNSEDPRNAWPARIFPADLRA